MEGLVRLSHTISNTMNKKLESENPDLSNTKSAWYDNDGVLRNTQESHWGEYENIGEVDEESLVKKEIEHLSRFELLLDKIVSSEVSEIINKQKKKRKD